MDIHIRPVYRFPQRSDNRVAEIAGYEVVDSVGTTLAVGATEAEARDRAQERVWRDALHTIEALKTARWNT